MSTAQKRLVAIASAVALVLALAAPASAGSLGRVSWSPSSINFGKVQVGSAPVRVIWVTNGLKVPALISSESLGGANADQFAAGAGTTDDCFDKVVSGEFLNPGETCGWVIQFDPQAAGAYSARFTSTLSLGPNVDVSYTVTVNLRGTGY
jgi:hypothetical protein